MKKKTTRALPYQIQKLPETPPRPPYPGADIPATCLTSTKPSKPWSKPNDVPSLCWLRVKNRPLAGRWFVIGVVETGVSTLSQPGDPSNRTPGFTWRDLEIMEWSLSPNIAWHPCVIPSATNTKSNE